MGKLKNSLKKEYEMKKKIKVIPDSILILDTESVIDVSDVIEKMGGIIKIGVIKDAIKEAILDGEIPNEYVAARDYMLKKGSEIGLKAI